MVPIRLDLHARNTVRSIGLVYHEEYRVSEPSHLQILPKQPVCLLQITQISTPKLLQLIVLDEPFHIFVTPGELLCVYRDLVPYSRYVDLKYLGRDYDAVGPWSFWAIGGKPSTVSVMVVGYSLIFGLEECIDCLPIAAFIARLSPNISRMWSLYSQLILTTIIASKFSTTTSTCSLGFCIWYCFGTRTVLSKYGTA